MLEADTEKKKIAKTLVSILGFLILMLVAYLVILPLAPAIKYELTKKDAANKDINEAKNDSQTIAEQNRKEEISGNRIIIEKIGVNAPIIESPDENEALSRGAWRLPESSAPDQGGNTVITGHRFKYLPPNNLTFFLLNKLVEGDIILVVWDEKNYFYKVKETKTVEANDNSILAATQAPRLTLFTCDPIYSEKNRLVVVGEMIEQ